MASRWPPVMRGVMAMSSSVGPVTSAFEEPLSSGVAEPGSCHSRRSSCSVDTAVTVVCPSLTSTCVMARCVLIGARYSPDG
jgi:hypothetical protein